MKRQDKNKVIFAAVFAVAFVFAVFLNFLTPYIVDDFSYMRNFATKGAIEKITDIFPSMAAHYFKMNGRTVPHFFAQLFIYLPKWIFNIVNGAMLAFLPFIISMFCREKKHRLNAAGYIALCAAIWIFEPVFGVVNLWLTGACNYLWGIVFSLIFLLVFVRVESGEKILNGKVKTVCFALFALLAGGYSENTSAAVIAVSFIIMIILCRRNGIKEITGLIIGWICAVVGYIIMALSPAGAVAKIAGFAHLKDGIISAVKMYLTLSPLLIVYIICAALFLICSEEKPRIITSLALFASSFVANFMMSFATYYEQRSLASAVIFLIGAIFNILSELVRLVFAGERRKKAKTPAAAALCALCFVCFIVAVPNGVKDIINTYRGVKSGEEIILAAAESGEVSADIPYVYAQTKYSPLYGLKYIDTVDSSSWPNHAMSLYYGIDTITGKE